MSVLNWPGLEEEVHMGFDTYAINYHYFLELIRQSQIKKKNLNNSL